MAKVNLAILNYRGSCLKTTKPANHGGMYLSFPQEKKANRTPEFKTNLHLQATQ